VTIEPKPADAPFHLNNHAGQEFNIVIEGRMEISIGGKVLTLETGDSIYFNAQLPHGMRALDGKTLKMLAIIM
jgi:quercetin dioxygenase-like cupin family protein